MKKILLTISGVCLVLLINAQYHIEALNYSRTMAGGTARSTAMGGAFGALGSDFIAAHQNPAGLGVYRSSEIAFTSEFLITNTEARYNGVLSDENKNNFNLNHFGWVSHFNTGNESGIKSGSFAIGYNRINNFHRNYFITGDNMRTSYVDHVVADANSGIWGDQQSLFFDAWMFDESTGAMDYIIAPEYFDNGNFIGVEQVKEIQETGKIDEWVFSFGINFEDMLYFGATLGILPLKYEKKYYFDEYQLNNGNFFFNYYETVKVRGTGVNGKFGLILKPMQMLRLGAAFHLPTAYYLEEDFYTEISSRFLNPDEVLYTDGIGSYKITTPYKAVGSVALVVGKFGLISSDLEYVDYASMKIKSRDHGIDFKDANEAVKNTYRSTINWKTGAEVRLGAMSLRGGVAYYGSPFKEGEENHDAFRLDYSGGLGFRADDFFLDATYVYSQQDERDFMYDPGVEDDLGIAPPAVANIDTKRHRIMLTLGFKF